MVIFEVVVSPSVVALLDWIVDTVPIFLVLMYNLVSGCVGLPSLVLWTGA